MTTLASTQKTKHRICNTTLIFYSPALQLLQKIVEFLWVEEVLVVWQLEWNLGRRTICGLVRIQLVHFTYDTPPSLYYNLDYILSMFTKSQ